MFDPASLLAGAALAAVLALPVLLWARARAFRGGRASRALELSTLQHEAAHLRERCGEREQALERAEATLRESDGERQRLEREHAVARSRVETLSTRAAEAEREAAALRARIEGLTRELAETASRGEEQARAASEKLALLERAREELKLQFQALSNTLLEEKTERLTRTNAEQLGTLLTPLREQLEGFRRKVEETYGQERVERQGLKLEIEQLRQLNERLGNEADELARALRGDQRAQGNWGEMVLERVLEASGLCGEREFVLQHTLKDDEGSRFRPDAIVRLPEGRDLIIDAKVSLTAYTRASACADGEERERELRAHVESIRGHIRGLAGRDYSQLADVRSPDFVLMFVPVEPALLDALRADPDLQQFALRQGVTLAGPSTLLMALRTVANLWRLEKQNRNAQAIADRAAQLYGKFKGFVDDLEAVGEAIGKAQGAFEGARNKLYTGRGNLLRQVRMLEELGVEPRTRLPDSLGQGEEGEDADQAPAGTEADGHADRRQPALPGA